MPTAQLTQALAALGDPTRRAVLDGLRGGERSVGDLASGLPVSRPAVSQHLAVLLQCGLVKERPAGTRRLYRIEPSGFESVRAYVEGFWTDVLGAYAAAAHDQATEGGTP
ncbi:MAG: metalloregulator ArsR/SmtB family transcription factor [Actinomycetota bacterium]|nr:metalloregulator ArsR/SmtB family transcription factor [Actinomycetota bacterium]